MPSALSLFKALYDLTDNYYLPDPYREAPNDYTHMFTSWEEFSQSHKRHLLQRPFWQELFSVIWEHQLCVYFL